MSEIKYTIKSGLPTSTAESINGITDTKTPFSPGVEVTKFVPEKPNNYQSVIIVPGFGHTVDKIGSAFSRLSTEVSTTLDINTLLTVDDQRDKGTNLNWTYLPTSVSMAIESAIGFGEKPAHIIAFSRHSQPAVDAVFNMLFYQDGMSKSKYYQDWERHKKTVGPILSLTLCAPAFWNNLRDIMEDRGSYHETADEKGPLIEIGSRKTKVLMENRTFKNWKPSNDDIKKYEETGSFLKDHGVKCKVLAAQNDPIVPNKISQQLADYYGFDFEIIKPQDEAGAIHDFDNTELKKVLLKELKSNLIKETREFNIMPELGVVEIQ